MKVNIVCPEMPHDSILYRLAAILSRETGWNISDQPKGNHDLNYAITYIDYAQRFTDWRGTPWAAYFSHYESGTPYKEFWWKNANDAMRIKTVTADQYGAMLSGYIIKIPPPIEYAYQPVERKPNRTPKVGISGFVDRSGRKGEKLVAQLAQDLEHMADFIGSGQGWPVRTEVHKLDDMPKWYNSLDLLICTSLIEGIPMPPLEALACGVPVVIPQGVGMLDELPVGLAGIYRYKVGSYSCLREAVTLALGELETIDKSKLVMSVAGYTPENYARAHVEGFTRALKKSDKATVIESDRHGQRGVYYVAFGEPARNCAMGAIQSFKKHLPDIPTALASDTPLGPEDVFIDMPDMDIGGRAAKIQIYDKAPKEWQYIAYLDADTEITAPMTLLWDVLQDGWDMVICKNPGKFATANAMRRSDNHDECDETYRKIGSEEILQLNGGVFAFQRNSRTKAFFKCWYREWMRYGKRDQAALLRSLWMHPIKLYVLGNEWNTITRYDNPSIAAWLLHYPMTARRWRGVVHYRLDDPQAWEAVRQFEASR